MQAKQHGHFPYVQGLSHSVPFAIPQSLSSFRYPLPMYYAYIRQPIQKHIPTIGFVSRGGSRVDREGARAWSFSHSREIIVVSNASSAGIGATVGEMVG